MSIDQITGIIRFKVAGQQAQPKWVQQQIRTALELQEAPPESLRFQCRIASDARENLKLITLDNGETLKLHPSSHPQFGKNHKGHPYLTATMVYSGDGASYTIKWVGDAVPPKMREVAVKHDKGLRVGAAVVNLDLSKANITPSAKVHGHTRRTKDVINAESRKRRAAGRPERTGKRTCARWTEEDTRQRELMSA